MKKIQELQIENFKFFTDKDNTLNIDGKNLLIWGENGSGKSSIYWAIYTILQCSFKDENGIDAYFTEKGEKNLINIHAPSSASSFVRMKLDNGDDYKISLGTQNVREVEEVQIGAVSSDFIDYKVLLDFLSFYHRDKPLLFQLFVEDIFRFLPFTPPSAFTTYKYFDNAWERVRDGLKEDTATKKFPSKGSTTHDQYKGLVDAFNLQLRSLLGQVTVKANKLLKKDFDYDIEIELSYSSFVFTPNSTSTKIDYTFPEIELKINKYYGKENVVLKPHSFLNEAKKTAIGLAIRLGILERRLLDATKLNILVLDDLLISLDMSNREIVLNLLINEYQKKYQLLVFTHDRQFYNIAKHKIEASTSKTDWLFWEFYVDEREKDKPKPRLFKNETELSIAYNHLLNNDYPASANYLRKHCEKVIETYLPQSCYADIEKKDSYKNFPLDSVLTKTESFLTSISQTIAVSKINNLKQYVKILLNPLSHTERGVERYKEEIKNVIKILDSLEAALKNIKQKRVLPSDTALTLTLQKNPTLTYKIKIKTKEDLYIYDDIGVIKLSKCKIDSLTFEEIEVGKPNKEGDFKYHQNKELELAYNEIIRHTSISIAATSNWQNLFICDDGKTLESLMTF